MVNPSPSRTISPSKFENTVYKRFKKCEKKRQKMIKNLQNQHRQNISERKWDSQYKWSDHVRNIEPIHKRLDDVIWKKEQWLRVQQKRKRDKENRQEVKECSFTPNLELTDRTNKKFFNSKRRLSLAQRSSRYASLHKEMRRRSQEKKEREEKKRYRSYKKRKRSSSLKSIQRSSERLYSHQKSKEEKLDMIRRKKMEELFRPRIDEIKQLEMRRIREERKKKKENWKKNIPRKPRIEEKKERIVIQWKESENEQPTFIGDISDKLKGLNLGKSGSSRVLSRVKEGGKTSKKLRRLRSGGIKNEQETYEKIFSEVEKIEEKRKLKKRGSRNSLKRKGSKKSVSRNSRKSKSVKRLVSRNKKSSKSKKSLNKKKRKNSVKSKKKLKKKLSKRRFKKKKKKMNSEKERKKRELRAKLQDLDNKIKQYEKINKEILEVEDDLKICDESLSIQAEKLHSRRLSSSRSKSVLSVPRSKQLSRSKSRKNLKTKKKRKLNRSSGNRSIERPKIEKSEKSTKRRNKKKETVRKRRKSNSFKNFSNDHHQYKTVIKKPPNPFSLDRNTFRIINLSSGGQRGTLKKNESEPLILSTPRKSLNENNELRMVNLSSEIEPEFDTFGANFQ